MKKDIWAAITFLTTGVLIYLAQVDGPPPKVLSLGDECGVVETMVVEENAPEASEELLFGNPRARDS